jgi:ubiquinone/menaquinone biosynthesis C-methylase UbiE
MSDRADTSFIKKLIGTRHEWESHVANVFRIFECNLQNYTPRNVLDIGCGDGERTIRIAKYYGVPMTEVYGLDYDHELILSCRKLFNAKRVDLERDQIPHDDNTFDLVICNQVLEHLKDYKKTIYEAIRVTKHQGYIVLGIPNLAHLINRIYLLFGIQPMCIHLDGPHVRSFTHGAFINLLNSLNSVKLLDFKGSLMYPIPFFIANRITDYVVGLSGYICYLMKKVQ